MLKVEKIGSLLDRANTAHVKVSMRDSIGTTDDVDPRIVGADGIEFPSSRRGPRGMLCATSRADKARIRRPCPSAALRNPSEGFAVPNSLCQMHSSAFLDFCFYELYTRRRCDLSHD